MIDKTIIVVSTVAIVSKLIAQSTGSAVESLPGLAPIAQLTATGAVIYLVIWLTTKTFPAMAEKSAVTHERIAANHDQTVKQVVKDFREESALLRAERDKERERVHCEFVPLTSRPQQ